MLNILILGANGMLGSALFRILRQNNKLRVFGTVRTKENFIKILESDSGDRVLTNINVEENDELLKVYCLVHPDVVINCIGLVKQMANVDDPLSTIPVNSLLPHRLARICELTNSRLIHISTDCVFDGKKGGYAEAEQPNATDLYGLSKYLGEVTYPNTVTLRTSIIGHELKGAKGLISWFLHQNEKCQGYTHAIFSGLPTVELARVIRDFVIPNSNLNGLYHVASKPIKKFELLNLVAEIYGKKIDIVPDSSLVIDRSLNADRFREATGYIAPEWPELIKSMYLDYTS
jgi:dTDP-4-dehydrorhamnose reductase